MPLKTPDITTAQITAAAAALIGLAVALGVPLSHDKQQAITTFVTVFAPVLLAADAAIRHGRARAVGEYLGAQAAQRAGVRTRAEWDAPREPGEGGGGNDDGERESAGEPDRPAEEPRPDEGGQPDGTAAPGPPRRWPDSVGAVG